MKHTMPLSENANFACFPLTTWQANPALPEFSSLRPILLSELDLRPIITAVVCDLWNVMLCAGCPLLASTCRITPDGGCSSDGPLNRDLCRRSLPVTGLWGLGKGGIGEGAALAGTILVPMYCIPSSSISTTLFLSNFELAVNLRWWVENSKGSYQDLGGEA